MLLGVRKRRGGIRRFFSGRRRFWISWISGVGWMRDDSTLHEKGSIETKSGGCTICQQVSI